MSTGIHESSACRLGTGGKPCPMCEFAEEPAQDRSESPLDVSGVTNQPAGFLACGGENAPAGQETSGIGISASAGTIRAALFDVLDENTRELYACDCEHHPVTDEEASDNRYRLGDMLINRIAELQRNSDAGLLLQKEGKR